ncbi:MAG TPA: NAD(P)/FAD-dependent oxidoreductase [Phycisphaerales bacterium]|nr:NAD(P)/FAD-dependent oxidoreductase [Phycisphaerales bacterium]
MLDVTIVGAGPAGLSAALVLGRCLRRVVVLDAGERRNARSRHMHNYPTRDGLAPSRYIALALREVEAVGVRVLKEAATHAERVDRRFRVTTDSGRVLESRRLLIATGVRDVLPEISGLRDCYGITVHHCPYCDAHQYAGRPLAAFGEGDAAVGLALNLRTWTKRVVACSHGVAPSEKMLARAERNGIRVRTERVTGLEHERGRMTRLCLESGRAERVDALFFNTGQVQRSGLAAQLGCTFREDGGVKTSDRQCTTIKGLYLAGDADKDVQFVVVAAAEGATAAVAINRELQDEERA